MDQNEREIIDGLFGKLRQAEEQTGPRDAGAERLIGQHVGTQPAAPYYMAQAILVQEQALQAANDRIGQLELELQQRPAGGGSFLGGLFGGGEVPAKQPSAAEQRLRDYQQRGGSGFLGGAMQTALGVAGGVMLGNLLMGAFAGDDAVAAEPGMDGIGGEAQPEEDPGMGFDDGGDFEF